MIRQILLIASLLFSLQVIAQTGIGTTTPNASAKLDVFSDNKGFLPPRVSLSSITDQSTIPSPATGLLVYCKGDAGLSAGYYFWNGNAWATIATAGGSGSFASSFLRGSRTANQSVALGGIVSFSAVDNTSGSDITLNTSDGKITLRPGNTYRLIAAVPNFSGSRPAFMWYNETSSSYIGSASNAYSPTDGASGVGAFGGIAEVIITPNVSTVVSFRLLSSLSSGAVTVGGVTDFSTTGSYPWFEAQVISGNAPVTGQTVEYGIARYSGSDGFPLSNLAQVGFDATAAGNLTWSGNKFTLKANKTYELESSLVIYQTSGASAGRFQIYDYTNSVILANGLFMSQNVAGTNNPSGNSPMKAIVTPSSDLQVGIRLYDSYGAAAPGIVGSTSAAGSNAPLNASYFLVKQIGSSAIVNPWTLSGTNTYNTTGNVGIGTSTPSSSAILDLTSASQGFLPPRIALTAKSGISSPITSPTTGLIVYNTASAGTSVDAVTPGYYYYNGSIWTRMDPEGWTTPVAITINGTIATPTKGTTSIDYVKYRNIVGKEYEIEYNYLQTSAGTSAGNGDYLISLPSGLQFDFTYPGQVAYTGAAGYDAMKNRITSSTGDILLPGYHNSITIIPYNATQFRIHLNNWGSLGWYFFSYGAYTMSSTNGFKINFRIKVP